MIYILKVNRVLCKSHSSSWEKKVSPTKKILNIKDAEFNAWMFQTDFKFEREKHYSMLKKTKTDFDDFSIVTFISAGDYNLYQLIFIFGRISIGMRVFFTISTPNGQV